MHLPGRGIDRWLVDTTGRLLDSRLTRRSFISKATMVGTAVAVSGCAPVTQPRPPYRYVTDCSGGLCRDGYTEFCCMINDGSNSCPPNSIPSGWWRADYSSFCDGTRYYVDCNDFSGGGPCRCAQDCNTRKVYCNQFRYGQCNTHVGGTGVIACRVVLCTPPYQVAELNCEVSGAVDNATAEHSAPCPPPPPPPPVPVPVAPTPGTVVLDDGAMSVVDARGTDGAVWLTRWTGTAFGAWQSLGGAVTTSRAAIANLGAGRLLAATRDGSGRPAWSAFDGSVWSSWSSLDGVITADPLLLPVTGGVLLVGRGNDAALHHRRFDGTSWSAWQTLPGAVISDPAGASTAGGGAILVGRGFDRGAYWIQFNGSTFGSWSALGGVITSDPVVAASPPGAVYVARGEDNQFYAHGLGGAAPASWEGLPPGGFTSEPAVAVGGGVVHVAGRGIDGLVYATARTGSGWSGWVQLAGLQVIASPIAVHDGSTVTLLAQGSDARLWIRRWSGSWDPAWTAIGTQTFEAFKAYS